MSDRDKYTCPEALNVAWHVRVNGLGDVSPSSLRKAFAALELEVEGLRAELATAKERLSSRGITELVELFTEMREAAARLLAQIDVTDDAEAFDEAIAAMRAVVAKLPPNG